MVGGSPRIKGASLAYLSLFYAYCTRGDAGSRTRLLSHTASSVKIYDERHEELTLLYWKLVLRLSSANTL